MVNRNNQSVFGQDFPKKGAFLNVDDDFEEVSYEERPASKRDRSGSRDKDFGLHASHRGNEDISGGSMMVRKRRNSNAQRLRTKGGNLELHESIDMDEDNRASQDSRRVSKIDKKMKLKSGILNINDYSDAGDDDLEEFNL